MKTKNLHLFLLMVVAGMFFILSACTKDDNLKNNLNSTRAILKSGSGPLAIGEGIYYNQGLERHLRFHAITHPNGSVQGSGEITSAQPQGHKLKFDIECLTVNGNAAVMSGIITESTFALAPVGMPIVFRVIDNGEGGSDPDQMSGGYLPIDPGWDDWDCNNFPEQDMFDIEQGNIQVIQ